MKKEEIINLDECVLNALGLLSDEKLPKIELKFKKPLVIGSGNAEVVGKILFREKEIILANEGNYLEKIKNIKGIDGAVLISASGGKHSPIIAKSLKKKRIKSVLLTNNSEAIAKKYVDKFYVFPKNIEPYTYNTSTYLSMILSFTGENPKKILNYLKGLEKFKFRKFKSFYFIIPEKFELSREMFETKFDELFGPKIKGRIFTYEHTKHAETIVGDKRELFIGLGVENKKFGNNKLNLSIPKDFGYVGFIALGYYLIGKIQSQNKPYFKMNIKRYVKEASEMFGENIEVMVR